MIFWKELSAAAEEDKRDVSLNNFTWLNCKHATMKWNNLHDSVCNVKTCYNLLRTQNDYCRVYILVFISRGQWFARKRWLGTTCFFFLLQTFVNHIELFRPLMRDAPTLLKPKFRQTSFEHKILPKNVQMPRDCWLHVFFWTMCRLHVFSWCGDSQWKWAAFYIISESCTSWPQNLSIPQLWQIFK